MVFDVSAKALLSMKKDALVPALQKLAGEMGQFDQQSADAKFPEPLTKVLGHKKLVKHADDDVKILVACCVADCLRIHAPDSPYEDDDQLRDIFELFITQVGGVQNVHGASYFRHAYLLERLAEVRTFLLLAELESDHLLRHIFEVCFDAILSSHGVRVEKHMLEILSHCVEGVEEVPQAILDTVLENLIEPRRTERPAAYKLAHAFLKKCGPHLHNALHQFLLGCLPTSMGTHERVEESGLSAEWRDLLVELATISPDTVTYLLPQLEAVVQLDDEATRLQGTELLAKLLGLPDCNLVKQLPSLFESAFLGRLKDISPAVRVLAVEHSVRLVQAKPNLAAPLLEALSERVMDANDKVREAVVSSVCEAASTDPQAYARLLKECAHRMADKKSGVRKAARDGLCALYRKSVSAHLKQYPESEAAPEEMHIIAQMLLQCYATEAGRDIEAKLEIETILSQRMLPADEQLRLRSLCALHAALKPAQRRAFRSIVRGKRIAQQEVCRWLELHVKAKASAKSGDGSESVEEQRERIVALMCKRLPPSDKDRAKQVWDAIGKAKDQKVAAQLRVLSSPSSTFEELTKAQEELRQRVAPRIKDEKHAPVLRAIAAQPIGLLWRDGAEQLLSGVAEMLEAAAQPRSASADESPSSMKEKARAALAAVVPSLEFLVDVAAQSPPTFNSCAPPLAAALAAAVAAAKKAPAAGKPPTLLLLRLAHAASPELASASPATRKSLIATLCGLCCNAKDEELGKRAAQALSTGLLVPATRQKTFEMLLTKLTPALDAAQPSAAQRCALAVLSALAKRDASALGPAAARASLLDKLMDAALPATTNGGAVADCDEAISALPEPKQRERCASQVLTVHVLANDVLGSYSAIAQHAGGAGGGQSSSSGGADAVDGDSASACDPAVEDLGRAASARAAVLIQRLLGALELDGKVGAAAAAGEEQQATLRLAAGRALLKLARLPLLKVDSALGPLGWHRVVNTMRDEDASVRMAFAKKVAAESLRPFLTDKRDTNLGAPASYLASRKLGLPPHYSVALAFAALDDDKDNIKATKGLLGQLVTTWRAAADKHSQPRALPEVQIPWLVHALAHHADYEQEDDDLDDDGDDDDNGRGAGGSATLPSTQRCLDLYLSACLAGGANGFDLLRHVVGKVKTAVDKVAPDGHETRVVSAIAGALVDQKAEGKKFANAPVPNGLSLPTLLYDPRAKHSSVDMLPASFKLIDGAKTTSGSVAIVPFGSPTKMAVEASGEGKAERRASGGGKANGKRPSSGGGGRCSSGDGDAGEKEPPGLSQSSLSGANEVPGRTNVAAGGKAAGGKAAGGKAAAGLKAPPVPSRGSRRLAVQPRVSYGAGSDEDDGNCDETEEGAADKKAAPTRTLRLRA